MIRLIAILSVLSQIWAGCAKSPSTTADGGEEPASSPTFAEVVSGSGRIEGARYRMDVRIGPVSSPAPPTSGELVLDPDSAIKP
jgi:hypothetical protein